MEIKNPWIIVHQPGGPGEPIETILAGDPSTGHAGFGLVIADIVGHVANAFNIDEADVMEWVNRELDNRTTTVQRTGPN